MRKGKTAIRVLALLIVGLVWIATLGAAEPDGGPALRFRRVYAPADRLEEWPLGKGAYLPVDPEEFEARVAAATAASRDRDGHKSIGLRRAVYRAQLVGEQLSEGLAEVEVEQLSSSPSLLSLEPCSLAVSEATWIEADPTPAVAGLGPAGQWNLLVERSGRLQLQWSLRGQRRDDGELQFDIRLPRCPVNRLVLDLPQPLRPEVDQGIVTAPADAGDGYRRWTLELGGRSQTVLRVVAADSSTLAPAQPILRQSAVYRLADEGLDLALQWNLDVPRSPIDALSAEIEPGLEIVAARSGDQPVRWRVAADEQGSRRVLFDLPKPLQGPGQVLHVAAIAPLALEKLWGLPTLHLEGVSWQEGTARVVVPASLELRLCQADDGQQSGAGTSSGGEPGEWQEYELYTPAARLEVLLARRAAEVSLVSGTDVEIRAGAMAGQIRADFSTRRGEVFTLTGEVARQWLIDSVETEPAAALDDWSVERSGTARRLQVQLAQALAPQRPIRLKIAARRLHSPLGRTLSVDDVVPVRLQAEGEARRLVAVHTIGPYDLQLARADALAKLQFADLPAAEQALFAEVPRGFVFEQRPDSADLQLTLLAQRPGHEANLQVEAVAAGGILLETCRISLMPESAALDRVVVCFSPASDSAVRWAVGPSGEPPLSAQRRILETRGGSETVATEQWEIRFRQPQLNPFELRATRSAPLDRPRGVSLAWLPEASRQRATLTVRCPGPDNVRIENRHLEAVPPELWPATAYPTIRGVFHYDAQHRSPSTAEADLILTPAPAAAAPAWAWECRLDSVYDGQGASRHTVVYRLQNTGARHLTFSLPSGAEGKVQGVWIDGEPTSWRHAAQNRRPAVQIELPEGRRFPALAVSFDISAAPFEHLGRLTSPMPAIDLPVLNRRWTVWLPPGFAFHDRLAESPDRFAPSEEWPGRLFGPLARRAGDSVFDPLAPQPRFLPESWREPAASDALAAQVLQTVVEAMARAKPPDWSTVFGLAQSSTPRLRWWIDLEALAARGITPDQPVPLGGSSASRDARPLEQAGLALLIDEPRVLVTTAERAARWSEQVDACSELPLWTVRPGPLANWLADADNAQAQWVIPAAQWTTDVLNFALPWPAATPDALTASDLHGWSALSVECPAAATVHVAYIRRATLQLAGWVALLAMAGLGAWLAARRPVLWVLAIGALATVSLLIDPIWLPLGWGGVLGLLAGWIARPAWSGPPAAPRREHSSTQSLRTATVTRVVALVLGAAAAMGGLAAADETAPPKTWSVFVPVDAQQQPTGDKYQVPAEFYNELHRLATAAGKRPEGWLLTSAVYRGSVQWQTAPPRPAAVELRARYELEVFSPGATVRLPLARDGVNLLPEGTLLDGRSVAAEWSSDGKALVLDVPDTGQHRLEVALRPTLQVTDAETSFRVTVPSLPSSRLELTLPAGASRPEIAAASGAVVWQESAPQLQADLGPVDQLSVRWPVAGTAGSTSAVDVQELLWLRIAPGAVVLDTRLRFRSVQGPIRQVELLADPRLRLYEDQLPASSVEATPGWPRRIRFDFSASPSEEVVVPARFLLTGSSGLGHVRLPLLEAVGARRTRRWLAVTVDPGLTYTPLPGSTATAMGIPEFLTNWGASPSTPTLAYTLDTPEASWGAATRRAEAAAEADSTLHLGFSPGQVDARFEADVEIPGGVAFQFRLAAPPELDVERVSLVQDSAERLLRWSRENSGAITLFLNGPASGRCRLELAGSMPCADGAAVHPPLVRLEKVKSRGYRVQLYRRASVLVTIESSQGLSAAGAGTGVGLRSDMGRAIDALSAEGEVLPSLTVRVAPNHPTVDADQMIWLLRRNGQWWARLDVALTISGGVLDQATLAAPPAWQGPFQAAPSLSLESVEVEGTRRLVVRPREAWSGSVRFSVLGPVAAEPSGWLSAPPIRLQDIVPRSRLLGVPAGPPEQPLWWETRGLALTEPPDEFAPPEELAAPQVYSLQGDDFQAVLRPGQPRQSTPEVHLAEMIFAWEGRGGCRGSALYDLEPGGLTECPLWLPRGLKLLQVCVDGVPTAARGTGEGRWSFPLTSSTWPQRIEVLVEGESVESAGAERLRFDAPTLGSLPVRQVLWTIYAPPGTPPGSVEGTAGLEPLLYELARLKTASALVELQSYSVAADTPDMLPWYRLWLARLGKLQASVERELHRADPSQPVPSVRAELEAIRHKEKLLRDRLGETAPEPPKADEVRLAVAPAELWQAVRRDDRSAVRCSGQTGSIAVNYPPAAETAAALPAGPVVGVLAWVLVALVGLRRGTWGECLRRWPAGAGVVVGLAWWLWLEPSALGLGIVAASLLATHRSRLWRPARSAGSSIIRTR